MSPTLSFSLRMRIYELSSPCGLPVNVGLEGIDVESVYIVRLKLQDIPSALE
jgi:hypothetical protein